MTRATLFLAAALAAAVMIPGDPAEAQVRDRIEGPGTYDECVADHMRGPVSDAQEQSIRLACHNRFVQRLASAAAPDQDFGYNPFVSWAANRDTSHGFAALPNDPRAGGQFSRALTDSRANGLRRVQALHRLATSRLVKVSGSVSNFSTITVWLRNDNGFPITSVLLGLSEEEKDSCTRPLSGYPATLSCPTHSPKIDGRSEGKVVCNYPGDVDIVTLCIIGFESGYVRADDFPAAMGLTGRQ